MCFSTRQKRSPCFCSVIRKYCTCQRWLQRLHYNWQRLCHCITTNWQYTAVAVNTFTLTAELTEAQRWHAYPRHLNSLLTLTSTWMQLWRIGPHYIGDPLYSCRVLQCASVRAFLSSAIIIKDSSHCVVVHYWNKNVYSNYNKSIYTIHSINHQLTSSTKVIHFIWKLGCISCLNYYDDPVALTHNLWTSMWGGTYTLYFIRTINLPNPNFLCHFIQDLLRPQ